MATEIDRAGLLGAGLTVLVGGVFFAAALAAYPKRGQRPPQPTPFTASARFEIPAPPRCKPAAFSSLERFPSSTAFREWQLKGSCSRRVVPADASSIDPVPQWLAPAKVSGVLGLLSSTKGSSLASIFGKNSALGREADALGLLGATSITNNQELGVDEGDIVKASRDLLIVLRRGRLFSIRHRDAGGRPVLTPISRLAVTPPGAAYDSWYDELLLHRNRVVVIGFSYALGATEIGLFRLAPAGQLSHQATFYLRSDDYYSSRNYASRLLGSRLVLYAPVPIGLLGPGLDRLAVGRWLPSRRRVARWQPLLAATSIYRPVQRASEPYLHSVVTCDLERAGGPGGFTPPGGTAVKAVPESGPGGFTPPGGDGRQGRPRV
jgi:hypothetical protein